MDKDPITEDWLRSVGFKWHQVERQPEKHWVLWLGGCLVDEQGRRELFTSFEDIGLELCSGAIDDRWFCWFRGDSAHRYHRFIHIRHLRFQRELVALIEAITGQAWDPANNLYGSMHTREQAARLRKESERLDLRWRHESPPHVKWSEQEKDDSRGRALPEHMEAAIKSGLAK